MSDIIAWSCRLEIIDNNPKLINEFGFRNLIFISDKAESPSWSIAITPFWFPNFNSRCTVYNYDSACTISIQCVNTQSSADNHDSACIFSFIEPS